MWRCSLSTWVMLSHDESYDVVNSGWKMDNQHQPPKVAQLMTAAKRVREASNIHKR